MSDFVRGAVAFFGVVFLVGLISYRMGEEHALECALSSAEPKVDTLFIFDTIVSETPIYKEKRVVERIVVPVVDTLRLRDTLYMYADREQVHWRDSLSDVYASGISVEVDSVRHFITERVVVKEIAIPKVQKSRWGIGVHVGYGVQLGTEVRHCPYVGIGISYDLLTW